MRREILVSEIAAREVEGLTPEQRSSLLLDWWGLGPEDSEWETLPLELRDELQAADEPGDPLDKKYNPLLVIALSWGYRGMKNEYLLRRARRLGIEVDGIVGEPELLEVCPCCLHRTLRERGGYDICPICFWEDDGLRRLDGYSGPNHMTLREGRSNFAAFGWCQPRPAEAVRRELREAYSRYEGDVIAPSPLQ